MFARKLSRLAGLVFVLTAIVGGVGAAGASAEQETGGSSASVTVEAGALRMSDVIWT